MRHISSSLVDPFRFQYFNSWILDTLFCSAAAGASAALYGPLHGGAAEGTLRQLQDIGSVANVPVFLDKVKKKQAKLVGFGHRVYKNFDPRAKIIRTLAYEVFEVCGHEPLIEVAKALEQQALSDDYFVKRKLYPNVDFYSGLSKSQVLKTLNEPWNGGSSLQSHGIPGRLFPGAICDSPHVWMVGSLGRGLGRSWQQDLETPSSLYGLW